MPDHLNRLEFDTLDEADIGVVFEGRPAEYSKAMERRYPKTTGQALRELQVRGFVVDETTRFVINWIATADLVVIGGEPVFFSSDIDRLADDLADCGNRFLSGRLLRCIEFGVSLYASMVAEREGNGQ